MHALRLHAPKREALIRGDFELLPELSSHLNQR
jgi:hypothetical protein